MTSARYLVVATALLAAVCGSIACTPHHQTPQSAAGESQEKTFTVTKKAYLHLREIRNALADEKYDAALEELGKMNERKFLNEHERALMWQLYAQTYASQGKLGEAAEALEKALALDALPEASTLDANYNLGQLYLVTEQFDKAARTMSAWLEKAENPKAEAYYITATAYAQDGNFEKALPYAQTAIEKVEEPSEQWLQLVMSLHFELEHFEQVAAVLKQLIESFPEKKKYWAQLSAVYMELNDEPRALAVLELAYRQKMLDDEEEILKLAKLYLNQGVPLKAARVIDAEMKTDVVTESADSMELLAKSWLHAREYDKALPILDEAAALGEDGSLYMQGARIMAQRDDWAKARMAARKALRKGIDKPGQAHLLIGTASYNLNQRGGATAAFREATRHESSKIAAEQWLDLLDKERQRCEAGVGPNCPEGSSAAVEEEIEEATATTIEEHIDPVQARFVGKFSYAHSPEKGREIVRSAVETAIRDMNAAEKAVARRSLSRGQNRFPRSISVALPSGKIAVRIGRVYAVTRRGRAKDITLPNGDAVRAKQSFDGARLQQVFESERGTWTNVFSLSPEGDVLQLTVKIAAQQLKAPITYRLDYRRK